MTQIVPASSNGLDAVNFRRLDETRSQSLHLEAEAIRAVAGAGVAQTPGEHDGMDADLFGAFNSIWRIEMAARASPPFIPGAPDEPRLVGWLPIYRRSLLRPEYVDPRVVV